MKNTNSKDYMDAVKAYLLPLILTMAEERGQKPERPFAWVIETAKSEVGHEFERHGLQAGLTYWLSGLGLYGLDFYNSDIADLAEKWHACKLSDKQRETVVEKWFEHIAWQIIKLARKEAKIAVDARAQV